MTSAIVWIIFATFVSQVHLGHMISVPEIGRFKSHYTEDELTDLQGQRAALWQTQPPINIARLSREDQYLDEGLWHVRKRNTADIGEAWRENLILERFFVPVLDMPTYASPNGNRWPPEQRADISQRAGVIDSYLSTAESYPIVVWPGRVFWSVVVVVALIFAIAPFGLTRRDQ